MDLREGYPPAPVNGRKPPETTQRSYAHAWVARPGIETTQVNGDGNRMMSRTTRKQPHDGRKSEPATNQTDCITHRSVRTGCNSMSGDMHAVKRVLAMLFGPADRRAFRVQLWDGSIEGPRTEQAAPFTIVLRRPGALRRMLVPPSELAMGEAYLRDDFDVLGDMEAATGLAELVSERLTSATAVTHLVPFFMALPDDDYSTPSSHGGHPDVPLLGRRHSRQRDRIAVRTHYDVGNDFYALWLDQRMVYSCAYFENEKQDLDTAQLAKLDYICRKLRLQPGERLLDVGCGWGALVHHAAEHYGVRATGITLSEQQAALARERIAMAGLSDRCQVVVRDYREFPTGTQFDKIASVGMVEHVGRVRLATYFDEIYRLLEPGGIFLNHGIVEMPSPRSTSPLEWATRAIWRPRSFIDRHVFPDGELVTTSEIISHAERAGFEARDVESLREHYALTLRHWVKRLEARHEQAVDLVGEPTYRVWRLYMAGSARGFATRRLNIVQTLLSKSATGGESHLPLSRADFYRTASTARPIRQLA